MPPDAEVVHRIAGRTRLRIAGKRNDAAYFSQLIEQIRACPRVREATANPLTGSLLIRYDEPFELVAGFAQQRQLFRLAGPQPSATLKARTAAGFEEASRNLEAVTGGELDLDGMLILGLTGLAIHQAIEGNIMAPAVTLMWYALNAARGTKDGGTGRGE